MKSLLKKLDEIIRLLNKLLDNKEAENENKDKVLDDIERLPELAEQYVKSDEKDHNEFVGKYFKNEDGDLFKVIESYGSTYQIIYHDSYDNFDDGLMIGLNINNRIETRDYISDSTMITKNEFQKLCHDDIVTYFEKMRSI